MGAVVLLLLAKHAAAGYDDKINDFVFLEGAALRGGTNGIAFDPSGSLWAAQSIGQQISKLDPESGEILETLGIEDEVYFTDDIVFASDGTAYWTEFIFGTIYKRSPGGPSEALYPFFTFPFANPLVLSDDETSLFFGQCFSPGPTGVYQLDLTTGVTTTILDGIPVCSSNSMDFRDGFLYTPRLFENRVVRIDLNNNNTVTNVATNLVQPNVAKFDSDGNLHIVDYGAGTIYRITDVSGNDTVNNRVIVAQPDPFFAIDNIVFDKDNRLFVSSVTRGTILEVLGVDMFRTITGGSFSIATGMAIFDGVMQLCNPNALYGYDLATGEETYIFEPVIGTGGLEQPTFIQALDDRIVLSSFTTNTVMTWNLTSQSPIAVSHGFAAPVDVLPFQDALLVANSGTNTIVKVTGETLETIEEVITLPGAVFMAGDDNDNVYATNFLSGEVVQFVAYGEVVDPPIVISTGHDFPEGIAVLDDKTLLVVSTGGSGSLESVDIATGYVKEIASGLGFLQAAPGFPIFFPNSVVVYNGDAYINADASNIIFKIPVGGDKKKGGKKKEMRKKGGKQGKKGMKSKKSSKMKSTKSSKMKGMKGRKSKGY